MVLKEDDMETIEELNAYSTNDFELWLKQRLEQVYDSDTKTRYKAFDFKSLDIQGESHLDNMGRLFDKLKPYTQKKLREAVYSLVSNANLDTLSEEIMKDLIFLIFEFNRDQILDDQARSLLLTIIPDGPWGQTYPELIYDCASMMSYFDPSTEQILLKKLVKTRPMVT